MVRERRLVSATDSLVALQDLDLLLDELEQSPLAREARRSGSVDPADVLNSERRRITQGLDRRWLELYERCSARYGRGLTAVRDRICLGCQTRLPTSAAPPAGIALLQVCESCGRLLLWV